MISECPELTRDAKERLRLAQANGLFLKDTEESIVGILMNQDCVTESDEKSSCFFDVDDLK